jgi:hypothetical protein
MVCKEGKKGGGEGGGKIVPPSYHPDEVSADYRGNRLSYYDGSLFINFTVS